jgi:predicted nucleic acid-binding protein
MVFLRMSPRGGRSAPQAVPGEDLRQPRSLEQRVLIDTAVWTWSRDRRFPELATWFNDAARGGRVLVCDLVVLELVRLAANEQRARELAARLASFEIVPMPAALWRRAREVQLLLAATGDHRRVPPADLLIAAAAEHADVPLVHYDRDYERISAVTGQDHAWFVPDGALV